MYIYIYILYSTVYIYTHIIFSRDGLGTRDYIPRSLLLAPVRPYCPSGPGTLSLVLQTRGLSKIIPIEFRWTPHPVIVTIWMIRIILGSSYIPTIRLLQGGGGVLLK